MTGGGRGIINAAREVAIYLAHEICDLKYAEISKEFGVSSAGVIGWHCAKVTEKLALNKMFAEQIKKIRDELC